MISSEELLQHSKQKWQTQASNTGACTASNFTGYQLINTTLTQACTVFGFGDTVDEIDIDFELYIPNDATGSKTVGIVAIGTY